MSVPTYSTVIIKLFTELDVILNSYVYNAYGDLAHMLKDPLGLAVTLYIVLMGISITQGWVKLSMSNFVKSAVKIAFIYMAAMNWGFFSEYVVHFIQGGAEAIGSTLLHATPISLPQFAGAGINGALQTVLIEFTKVGDWVWNTGSWRNLSPYFCAIMLWLFGYILILVGSFELALAKIMLAILFATAPIFICFTMFKPTHGWFDRWLGAVAGFAFLIIFVSAILALAMNLAEWCIGGTYADHALNMNLVGFVPTMLVGFICVGLVLKVSGMAQSIGGTVTTSSASALLAGTVGGFVGGSMATLKQGKSLAGAVGLGNKSREQSKTGSGSSGAQKTGSGSSNIDGLREKMRSGASTTGETSSNSSKNLSSIGSLREKMRSDMNTNFADKKQEASV